MFSCLWFRHRRAVSSTVRWRHSSLFTTVCPSHSNTAPSLWRAAGCCLAQWRPSKHIQKHTHTLCWAHHYINLQNNRTFQQPLLYDSLHMCVCRVSDVDPGYHLCVAMHIRPYRAGLRKLVAYFDCSAFRDIKASCTLNIKPQQDDRWCGVPNEPLWVTPTQSYTVQQ